jgi:hypothetical protein
MLLGDGYVSNTITSSIAFWGGRCGVQITTQQMAHAYGITSMSVTLLMPM